MPQFNHGLGRIRGLDSSITNTSQFASGSTRLGTLHDLEVDTMRLNHVVLATALALTMSNDLDVSAGNADTIGTKSVQGEDEDGDSGSDTQETSDLLASSDKEIMSGDMSGDGELDDLLDMGGSDGFAALMKSLGGLEKTGSTSGSEDDDFSSSSSSGSASDNDDSSTSDPLDSSKGDSGSDDPSGSREEESRSDDMSGGSELNDVLDMSGSDGFAAFLKSLGGLESTEGSSGISKTDDETKEAASASGEMDLGALLSGLGGTGGGLDGLLNPTGPIAAAGSDVTDDDGSSGATPMPGANGTGRPSCDTWYRPFTSWIGNLYHKSSMNDCPTTRRLRAD